MDAWGIGNLAADPELRTTESGVYVCNFDLACERRVKKASKKGEVDFIPVVVWRDQAEACAKYLRKGSQVVVRGFLQTRMYEKKNGGKVKITEVIADEVKFVSRWGEQADPSYGEDEAEAPEPPSGEAQAIVPPPVVEDPDLSF
jgi:single-strand DNA-binding protein